MEQDEINSLVLQCRLMTIEQITKLLHSFVSKKRDCPLVRKFMWKHAVARPDDFWTMDIEIAKDLTVVQVADLQQNLRQVLMPQPLPLPRVTHVGFAEGVIDLVIPPERVSLLRDAELTAWPGSGLRCRISLHELQTMARIVIYLPRWRKPV